MTSKCPNRAFNSAICTQIESRIKRLGNRKIGQWKIFECNMNWRRDCVLIDVIYAQLTAFKSINPLFRTSDVIANWWHQTRNINWIVEIQWIIFILNLNTENIYSMTFYVVMIFEYMTNKKSSDQISRTRKSLGFINAVANCIRCTLTPKIVHHIMWVYWGVSRYYQKVGVSAPFVHFANDSQEKIKKKTSMNCIFQYDNKLRETIKIQLKHNAIYVFWTLLRNEFFRKCFHLSTICVM